jgi:hypothetical protein
MHRGLGRDACRSAAPANCGVWSLYVGLFLALLTFFIALVSLSPPDASRTTAVLDSVQRRFAAAAPELETDILFPAGKSALAELGGDLAGIVRIDSVKHSRRGDELRVQLAVVEMFADDTTIVRPQMASLLDRIVAALGSPPAGLRLQVSFALGRPQPMGADKDDAALSLAIARCGFIARDLIARGAPPGLLAVAIGSGPPDRATFLFRFITEGGVDNDRIVRP